MRVALLFMFVFVWVFAFAVLLRSVRERGGRLTISLILAFMALTALVFGGFAVAVPAPHTYSNATE